MREILFRGKRIDNYEWIYGDLDQTPDGGTVKEFGIKPFAEDTRLVITDTVGQFTGLIDKYKTKIFENDLLINQFGDIYKANWRGVLYCINKQLACDISKRIIIDFEVIGNIHDNPELLK